MLIVDLVDDFETVLLGKTGCNHTLLQLHKRLAFLFLNLLKSFDQGFFSRFKLLGFLFVFVNHLFFVVDFGLILILADLDSLLFVDFYRSLALCNHTFDILSSVDLWFFLYFIILFLSHSIFPELVSDCLHALFLWHVHIVFCVVDLLPAHFLLLVGGLSTCLCLFLTLHLHVLLPLEVFIIFLSQIDKFISFFSRFCNFLLSFHMLLLEHTHAISQQFDIIFDPILEIEFSGFDCWLTGFWVSSPHWLIQAFQLVRKVRLVPPLILENI